MRAEAGQVKACGKYEYQVSDGLDAVLRRQDLTRTAASDACNGFVQTPALVFLVETEEMRPTSAYQTKTDLRLGACILASSCCGAISSL